MPRVLHVAESFASGVASAISDYVDNSQDVSHHLLYATRADAPADPQSLGQFMSAREMADGTASRVLQVRAVVRDLGIDVIHAHSSFAGLYVRLAALTMWRVRVVYTPHCFAFERNDLSRAVRFGVYGLEKLLAVRTDVLAGCSDREVELGRRLNQRTMTRHLPNIVKVTEPTRRDTGTEASLVVAGAGRMGVQKGPEFFASVVVAAQARDIPASFVWLGDGTAEQVDRLTRVGVRVSGWLVRSRVYEELAACDLYMHTAMWEGYPLGILEATASGVPTVVRATDSTVHFPAFAQFRSPDDAVDLIERAMSPKWRTESLESWYQFTEINSPAHQGDVLSELYGHSAASKGNARMSLQRNIGEPACKGGSQ